MLRILLFSYFLLIISGIGAQKSSPYPFQEMKFRFVGPDGNRAIAVAGEAGNPMVSYVGAASGGIFKTTDGGYHWKPIFDEMDNAAIGALAVSVLILKSIRWFLT